MFWKLGKDGRDDTEKKQRSRLAPEDSDEDEDEDEEIEIDKAEKKLRLIDRVAPKLREGKHNIVELDSFFKSQVANFYDNISFVKRNSTFQLQFLRFFYFFLSSWYRRRRFPRKA